MESTLFVLMERTLRLERGRDLPIASGRAVAEPEFDDVGGTGREGKSLVYLKYLVSSGGSLIFTTGV